MRLGRAGFAAGLSALAMAVLFVLEQLAPEAGPLDTATAVLVVGVYDAAMWIWVIAYAVLVVRLPAAERPIGRRWPVARWAAIVAAIAPAVFLLAQLTDSLLLAVIAFPAILVAIGVSLLALDLTLRPRGVISGGLASIGIVTGLAFVAAGIGYGVGAFADSPLAVIGVSALLGGQILYVVWATWVGRRLRRGDALDGPAPDDPGEPLAATGGALDPVPPPDGESES